MPRGNSRAVFYIQSADRFQRAKKKLRGQKNRKRRKYVADSIIYNKQNKKIVGDVADRRKRKSAKGCRRVELYFRYNRNKVCTEKAERFL